MTFFRIGGELFWHPAGRDFSALQHSVNDVVGRAKADLYFSSHLICCYMPVLSYHSFHFRVSVRPIRRPDWGCIHQIWHPTFKPVQFIYLLKGHTFILLLPLHSAMSICNNFSPSLLTCPVLLWLTLPKKQLSLICYVSVIFPIWPTCLHTHTSR